MNPEELGKDTLVYNGIYRGKVVAVSDPKKLGRIKVKIVPFTYDIDDVDALPWAVPAFPLGTGAGAGYGSYAVPEVGSWVWVFFEGGDVYAPVYFAEACTGVEGQPTFKDTNYPNRRGFITKAGIEVFIDDTVGSRICHIKHPSGAVVEIADDGAMRVSSPVSLKITAARVDIN